MSQETMPWELANTFELTPEEAQAEWTAIKKPIGKGDTMTTQGRDAKEFETRGITIARVDKDGKELKRPILVFPVGTFKSHGNYPVRLSVDKAFADTIKQGELYHGFIERGEARKQNPEYDTDYFWNVREISPGPSGAPAAAVPKAQDGPQAPRSGPSEAQAEAPPWDESWSEERRAAVVQALARDITRISIERQTALKAAVELAGYSIAQGQNMRSPEVLLVASKFEEWLRTGKLPPVVLQPKQPVAEAKGETP